MASSARLVLLAIAAIGLHATAAHALKFEVLPTTDNRGVLLIRDCSRFIGDYEFGPDGKVRFDADGEPLTKCQPWERSFSGPQEIEGRGGRAPVRYAGDAASLRSHLERARPGFSEVWLVSNGGDVQTGIEIGRLLRTYRVTVRVPDQTRLERATGQKVLLGNAGLVSCVSSCTIAFMGGMFRYKDDAASYQVHSASGVMTGISDQRRGWLSSGDLDTLATTQFVVARLRARQIFTHFQNTLLLYTTAPQRPENDSAFEREATDMRGVTVPYSATQKAKDLERIRNEGTEAAGQDIIMRIERDSMQAAIDELRLRTGSLGPRAEPALKMLEAMYDVGILATQSLSKQTMLRMGYLTRDLSTEP